MEDDFIRNRIARGICLPASLVDHEIGDGGRSDAPFTNVFNDDGGVVEVGHEDLVVIETRTMGHFFEGDGAEDGILGVAKHADLTVGGIRSYKYSCGVIANNAGIDDAG